ncbi:MAG: HD domain-containing protein [Clostridia bacterium]|nr:HD domain-containing protein [Clostridia bacterium]
MQPSDLLHILTTAEKLKCNTRHSYTSSGRHESVAEHSWCLALMAMLIQDEFPEVNMNKVIEMCLIHDLGEAFTGDIPTFDKTRKDEELETRAYQKWIDGFPDPEKTHWSALLDEMNEMKTKEAQIYKALDKMEAVIQHNQADLSTWLPLEYDLQFTYGTEQVAFSPYMMRLKEAVDQQTRKKIAEEVSDSN